MHKFTLRTTVLAAALVCSSLAFAATPQQGSSANTAASSAEHPQSLLDQLNLTDAQKTSIRNLLVQNMQQARTEMQTLRPKEQAFTNAKPGTSEYRTATTELATAESTAAHAQVLRQAQLREGIYNVLTPDQRTKLASLRAQREAQIEKMRQQRAQQQSSGAPASSGAPSR